MRTSKSRSRGKRSNNNRYTGNIINRVFDSSGPEGKVRGTPQQIIEKYSQLHRDSQLSNDRVAAENFQQHAEHYARMLTQAQREQDELKEAAERSFPVSNKDQVDSSPSRDKVANNSSKDINEVKFTKKAGLTAPEESKDYNSKKNTKPSQDVIKKDHDVSAVKNEEDKLNDQTAEVTSKTNLAN